MQNTAQLIEDRATRAPPKTGGAARCPGRVRTTRTPLNTSGAHRCSGRVRATRTPLKTSGAPEGYEQHEPH